jgi:hypothetical protein
MKSQDRLAAATQNGLGACEDHRVEPGQSEVSWKNDAMAALKQEGLVEYQLSAEGIRSSSRIERPGSIFVGTGVCTSKEISTALPLDALGMVLPAVRLQRAIGARSVVLLIADEHARSNGCFAAADIDAIAAANEDALKRAVSAFGLNSVKVVRASHFHAEQEYLDVLAEVDRRAPGSEHTYFRKEVADIQFLDRVCSGIIKLGWTVSSSVSMERRHDEVAFDRRFRAWMGNHVAFAYCKAGRVLDERRPKASPYVATDPARRVCLRRGEDVRAKLSSAESLVPAPILKGVKKHLGAVVRSFCSVVEPVDGEVEDRAQQIIGRVFGSAAA